ncbi:Tad domain-containing protein [Nitrosomonas sp. Nm132]|uniref:Tad domain-containing protein n=1 Tax=Nitrosomonas sp. Nm132 TaxID=1881053 RepID=UPI0008860DDB|nr:Tad domain-containing protein [Nitrosomonas sp. Nm132]SDH42427.1 Putative Flp pilus-assembly TadE/G-like [Nitrosomonas sp. Nm132]
MNPSPVRLSTHRNFHSVQKETGAVAIIVALSLVGLVGFVGLALDLGKLFVAKTELQNSADACALAAARELTGANTNQLELAEAAGKTTGERHNVLFQDEQIVISSVTFSETLAGGYDTAAAFTGLEATKKRFARCEASKAGIANWFIQVLNLLPGTAIGDQTVAASAVATLSPSQITSCAIPVGICSDQILPTIKVGDWLGGTLTPGNSISGSFKWIDFTPPSGGAQEVADTLEGPGTCNLPAKDIEIGESGYMAVIAKSWNTRFGIYPNGNPNAVKPNPDFSGYAYTTYSWPTQFDAFSDFKLKRANNRSYQGDVLAGLNVEQHGVPVSDNYLIANGTDRRMATAPIVNCGGFSDETSSTASIEGWACVLMLHPINQGSGGGSTSVSMFLEYLGRSNEPNSPCATNGVPAGPTAAGPMVPALVR